MHKLRPIFPVILVLALGWAVLGSGCEQDPDRQQEIIQPTDSDSSAEWPLRDPAAVQACMRLDPDELISSLPPEYINNPTYCETDSDCFCQSGSGVPFVGCANAYHARTSFAGCYACSQCVCIENICRQP